MKPLPWVIVAAIVAGVLLLQFSFVNGGEENWDPVHLPFPGPGLTVTDSFELASGGNFRLEVATPATEQESNQLHREQPDVKCDLALTITGPHNFRTEQRIIGLHNGSWTRNSNFYTMNGKTVPLPRRGRYEIALRSGRMVDTFSERGAVVGLARVAPVNLGYAIARLLAYACFVAACIGALATADTRPPQLAKGSTSSRMNGVDGE